MRNAWVSLLLYRNILFPNDIMLICSIEATGGRSAAGIWPVGFSEKSFELPARGISIIILSTVSADRAKNVADEINFESGDVVTRDIADQPGSCLEGTLPGYTAV